MKLLIVIAVILASFATYAIARTIETIRRERREIEQGAARLTQVRWEDEDVYTAYEREAQKRGKGVR